MPIRILRFDLHRIDLRTRMPFRYGIATMTHMPEIFVRLWVEIDGKEWTGISSDCLPPKWFTKIPGTPVAEEIAEMLRVIQKALSTAAGMQGDSAFEIWRQLYDQQSAWAGAQHIPPLLSHFGTSLVERALIEAASRAAGKPFATMLQENRLGIALGAVHPELSTSKLADFLPAKPLSKIIARHTVGLNDPLTDGDVPASERLHDDLPQSLVACIKKYGLRHFKIKVSGESAPDLERLSRVALIIQRGAPTDFAFSLDGNEQFKSLEEFQLFWEMARAQPKLKEFFNHLLFVEQPLHRACALQPELGSALTSWRDRPSIIIDESDASLEDLPTALQLGYAGTSHKNCKGVFKGIINRCLLAKFQQNEPQRPLLMSGEDLCNIGPVALLQDLAVMSVLGIRSVERNGHHYHAGLSQFPAAIQSAILSNHGDLYEASSAHWPTLKISNGEINLASIHQAPLGVGFPLEVELFAKVDDSREEIESMSERPRKI